MHLNFNLKLQHCSSLQPVPVANCHISGLYRQLFSLWCYSRYDIIRNWGWAMGTGDAQRYRPMVTLPCLFKYISYTQYTSAGTVLDILWQHCTDDKTYRNSLEVTCIIMTPDLKACSTTQNWKAYIMTDMYVWGSVCSMYIPLSHRQDMSP